MRATRTIWLEGFAWVKQVWFVGYPPFCSLDVRCWSDAHHADPQQGQADEWSVGYVHWMLAVKRLARAFRFLDEHRSSVLGTTAAACIPSVVVDELRSLLDAHHSHVGGREGSGAFLGLCDEVYTAVLEPARV